jgi:hypothetical protein
MPVLKHMQTRTHAHTRAHTPPPLQMAPPTKQEIKTLASHLNQLAAPTRAPTDASTREQLQALFSCCYTLTNVSAMAATSPSALAPVIPPLVKLLSAHEHENEQHGNKDVRFKAAGAISALAKHGDKLAVAAAIPGLVEMLGPSSLLCMQKMSAGALRSLAENTTLKTAIAAAGALPALRTLLGPSPASKPGHVLQIISLGDMQIQAAAALLYLVEGNADNQAAASGCIPDLVRLMGSAPSRDDWLTWISACALSRLACDAANRESIAAAVLLPLTMDQVTELGQESPWDVARARLGRSNGSQPVKAS